MATQSCYRVVPDSNFLLIPFEFGVDIFAELDSILDVRYEIFMAKSVLRELKRLSECRGKSACYARGALSIAEKFKVIESGKNYPDADSELFDMASKNTVICTNDKFLKVKIKEKKAPFVYLRQKKYLKIEGLGGYI